MPLPTALKKWISDCKAYAAKHNCSYKQAMSALKKLKKSRKSYNGGGAGALELNGSPLNEGFAGQEGMKPVASGGDPPVPLPPATSGGDAGPTATSGGDAGSTATPAAMSGGGGMSMFEAGQVGGKRRRRRGSKSKRQSQSQSQSGGKRRKSRRGPGRRRRSSRGGSALSYSQY
jgi:hypothetical protein